MHHSKLWIAASLLLVFVFMLGACAQATPPPPVEVEVTREVEKIVEATVVVKEEVVVTQEVEVPMAVTPILYNSYNGDPKPRAFDEKIVADWNAAHPEMPVEHSIIAHEDFKQAIRAYLTAEPAPDVLTWFAGNRARFFIDKGLVYDSVQDVGGQRVRRSVCARLPGAGHRTMTTVLHADRLLLVGDLLSPVAVRAGWHREDPRKPGMSCWAACDKLNAAGVTPIHHRRPLQMAGGCLVRLSEYAHQRPAVPHRPDGL